MKIYKKINKTNITGGIFFCSVLHHVTKDSIMENVVWIGWFISCLKELTLFMSSFLDISAVVLVHFNIIKWWHNVVFPFFYLKKRNPDHSPTLRVLSVLQHCVRESGDGRTESKRYGSWCESFGDYFQLWIKNCCVNDGSRAMCVDWIKAHWMDKYGQQCEENVTLE